MSNPDELISVTSQDYRKRKLHPEFLQLQLSGAELELPSSLLNDLSAHFTMNFKCKTAKGFYFYLCSFLQLKAHSLATHKC